MSSLPSRSIEYAQNFLKSPCLVNSILDRCNISRCDIVYEIGPGKGIITGRLACRCRQVIAIEKDSQFAALLRRRFAGASNITIYEGDFLHFRLPRTPYKVFASIPFNITTAVVTRLTTAPHPPDDAYLVMQKEAAEKFLGLPGESLYAVLLKPVFELEVVHRFRRSDFVPAPRVDVVMLRLRKRGPPLLRQADMQLFRDFLVHAFTTRQPSLSNTFKGIFTPRQLRQAEKFLEFNFEATPTAVRFEQWLKLFEYFKKVGSPQAIQAIIGSERRFRKRQSGLGLRR